MKWEVWTLDIDISKTWELITLVYLLQVVKRFPPYPSSPKFLFNRDTGSKQMERSHNRFPFQNKHFGWSSIPVVLVTTVNTNWLYLHICIPSYYLSLLLFLHYPNVLCGEHGSLMAFHNLNCNVKTRFRVLNILDDSQSSYNVTSRFSKA